MIAYDASGQSVKLSRPLAQGGEAIVYHLQDRPALVAKLYVPAPRPGYGEKVKWMQAHPPGPRAGRPEYPIVAWPEGLLYNRRRQFVGYLMPFLPDAVPLLQAYSPRLREKRLPHFDARYRYRAAANLARILAVLHDRGYIIGDLNESNILVAPDARVTVVDVDSFQVRTDQGLHPCPVGKAEYLPPELQGRELGRIRRAVTHDYFALAVLIFKLLMDGRHPFQGRWLREGEPPALEAKIARGWFPHTTVPGRAVAPPLNTPALDSLDPTIADLMRRCFIDGHHDPATRPAPEVWARELEAAERRLRPCQRGHYFPADAGRCSRCGARRAIFPRWLYRLVAWFTGLTRGLARRGARAIRRSDLRSRVRSATWRPRLPGRNWWAALAGINHPWVGAIVAASLSILAGVGLIRLYPYPATPLLPSLPPLLIAFTGTVAIARLVAAAGIRPDLPWYRSIRWDVFDGKALGRMLVLTTILLPVLATGTATMDPVLAALLGLPAAITALLLKRRGLLPWAFIPLLALSLLRVDLQWLLAASLLLHAGLFLLHAPVWLAARIRPAPYPATLGTGRGLAMGVLWLLLAAALIAGEQWPAGNEVRFTEAGTPGPAGVARVVNVAPLHLNVRRGPGLDRPIIARLQAGTEVELFERRRAEEMTWQRIRAGKIEGWVSTQYLEAITGPDG